MIRCYRCCAQRYAGKRLGLHNAGCREQNVRPLWLQPPIPCWARAACKSNALLQFRTTRATQSHKTSSHNLMKPRSSGTVRTLRSGIYPALKSAVIDHWCGGLASTQRSLTETMGDILKSPADDLARQLTPYLRRLRDRGIYIAQRAAAGSKGDEMSAERATSPHTFNWSALSPEDATLATVAEAYLCASSDMVKENAKSAFRSAMRVLLDLPTKCPDSLIFSAATRHKVGRLYFLPEQLYARATAEPLGLSTHTASNHRAALRAAMRFAAKRDLVPMVFPTIWPTDAWSEGENRYWPMSITGRTPNKSLTFRTAYRAYRDGCRALFGDEVQPEAITADQVTEVVRYVKYTQGRLMIGYNVSRALRDIAARFGEGPLASAERNDRIAPYLRGPNGESGEGSPDSFVALLQHYDVPRETREFVLWYSRYVSIDSLTLLRNPGEFPPRRSNQQIKRVTLQSRISALRLLIGVAIHHLNMPANSLTPEVLFGDAFIPIVGALERWWLERAATLPQGSPGSAKAGGVRQHVINLGQWALACYELERFRTGQLVASREIKNGERIDVRTEQLAAMSIKERRFWNSYRHASLLADALAGHAKGVRSSRGLRRVNEMRNIRRMFRSTPPSWWISILDALIGEVREAKKRKECTSMVYHQLVLNTFTLGAYISTGFRDGELCTVRLDLQFSPEAQLLREITLRPIDRKNGKTHTARLHAEYVPDDILTEYLRSTRPYFMSRLKKSRPKHSALVDHPFLLVNTEGVPYGCVEEDRDGRGRDEMAFKARVGKHGQRFRQQFLRIAAELEMPVPSHSYEFGLHPIRNVCGYGIFHLLGETAAANYLGDEPGQVLKSYAAIDGLMVDSTALKGLVVDQRQGRTKTPLTSEAMAAALSVVDETTADNSSADYATELERLLHRHDTGLIDTEELGLLKSKLRRRFGHAA